MIIKISCLLLSFYLTKTISKNVISISIDKDKPKDSSDSDEKNRNDKNIEIHNSNNQTYENVIPISSDSGSLETYEPSTDSEGKAKDKLNTKVKNVEQNHEPGSDNVYFQNILNSFEETKKLWPVAKNVTPSIITYLKKMPKSNAKNEANVKDNNFGHHSIKACRHNKYDDIIYDKVNMRTEALSYNNKKANEVRNTMWTKPTDVDTESDKISNTYGTKANKKLTNLFENTATTKNQSNLFKYTFRIPLSDHNQKIFNPKDYRNLEIETESDMENLDATRRENEDSGNSQNTGYKELNQKQISCLIDDIDGNTKKNYKGLAIATKNATIEVSDRHYQENMSTQESDDDDQSSLDDYPYSVSVQRKGAHYASGALVGAVWVLSTADEFYNVRETIKLFRLRLGTVDCKKGGVVIPLKVIIVHPGFAPGRPAYDISLLRMAEPVPLSSIVKPIGLSRVVGKVMTAKFLTTYWPRIVSKKGVVPSSAKERVKYNRMRVSTQKVIPLEECNRQMAAVNVTLNKTSLCLQPVKPHHSDCMPDIGAPVVAVDGLWGITSGWVSPRCPREPLPTVLTRVSTAELRLWINLKMQE